MSAVGRRVRHVGCVATWLMSGLLVGTPRTMADVPPGSAWQVTGTERVVARVLGNRFASKGGVEGVLTVDDALNWSMDVFPDSVYTITVGGPIEQRSPRRFVPRMDDVSRAEFGGAIRQMLVNQGADDVIVKRVRSRMRGKERSDGNLRIRSVTRVTLRLKVRSHRARVAMRAVDRWDCARID